MVQTSSADTAEKNLLDVLENGQPAIVWASVPSLPYSTQAFSDFDYYLLPILVYGHTNGTAYIVDRAGVPFTATVEQLAEAQSKVKKYKHRMMTVDAPDASKLETAVTRGIWQTISLYTEAPPKGSKNNFGLNAYQQWAKMLTNTRNKNNWERFFPAGSALYSALTWGYMWIIDWGAGEGFERNLYADFLDEAAVTCTSHRAKRRSESRRVSGWRPSNQKSHRISPCRPTRSPIFGPPWRIMCGKSTTLRREPLICSRRRWHKRAFPTGTIGAASATLTALPGES